MTARTADTRPDGLHFDMPQAVLLETVMTGQQLLNIVGPAYAYVFEPDELEGEAEHEAAKALLGEAHDAGEIYSMISPAEQIDLAQSLGERLLEALRDGLVRSHRRRRDELRQARAVARGDPAPTPRNRSRG